MFVSWKRNVLFETAVLFTERWRHLTYSNEPNFINNVLLVAKEYFHFKLSNVTKLANLYWIVLFPRVRDENGGRKNQLNKIEEYAREAKPTERGRVWEGAGPLPRQEPQQFDPKNGAFSWILNHESVGGEWLQSHPYSHLGLDILRLSSYCLSTLILGIHLVLYSITFRCKCLILKGNA